MAAARRGLGCDRGRGAGRPRPARRPRPAQVPAMEGRVPGLLSDRRDYVACLARSPETRAADRQPHAATARSANGPLRCGRNAFDHGRMAPAGRSVYSLNLRMSLSLAANRAGARASSDYSDSLRMSLSFAPCQPRRSACVIRLLASLADELVFRSLPTRRIACVIQLFGQRADELVFRSLPTHRSACVIRLLAQLADEFVFRSLPTAPERVRHSSIRTACG